MNKYRKLVGDSIVYLVGNIGSKVIALVMVSFYSFMLSPEQFGDIDVTQTTVSLILPFVTVCIHEAVLRFSIKSQYNETSVLSNGIFIECISLLASIPLCILMNSFNVIGGNVALIILLVGVEGLNTLFGQFCRAINKTKVFMSAGVMFTFVMASSNIVLLKYLKMGINGYFLAMVIGYVVSVLILFFGGNIYRFFDIKAADRSLQKKMIAYSLPLIPNSIMWWMMNAADKYVILALIGSNANGIYAVAGKLPTIISTFTTIFMQAWQVSAISESDAKDKNNFYSNVFNALTMALCMIVSGILIILKPFLAVVINSTYTDAWKYVPFLLLSASFSSFSAFLGTNYTAMGKTGGALKTTLVGGLLNVVLNVVFIKMIGLNGAALATAVSFFVVWQMRVYNTKQFVKIDIDVKNILFSSILIALQIIAVYCFNSLISALIGIWVLMSIVVINRKKLKEMFMKFFVRG